jgi:hypothetical protein
VSPFPGLNWWHTWHGTNKRSHRCSIQFHGTTWHLVLYFSKVTWLLFCCLISQFDPENMALHDWALDLRTETGPRAQKYGWRRGPWDKVLGGQVSQCLGDKNGIHHKSRRGLILKRKWSMCGNGWLKLLLHCIDSSKTFLQHNWTERIYWKVFSIVVFSAIVLRALKGLVHSRTTATLFFGYLRYIRTRNIGKLMSLLDNAAELAGQVDVWQFGSL